jgi:hypothetical protein
MEKKIVFVGGSLVSSQDIVNLGFRSDKSLLDGDLIVFSIDMSAYYGGEQYKGMTCLDDSSSFRLRRDCGHWRSELEAALKDGKTVIVFINDSPEVQAATGEKQYSGTGRNTRTTRIVSAVDPYESIPVAFGVVVRRSGERIKTIQDLGILSTYWHEFGNYSPYEAYIESFTGVPLLQTQTGGKVIGGILRSSKWKGSLIFLPPPNLDLAVEIRVKEFRDKQKRRLAKDSNAKTRQAESLKRKAEKFVANQFISALNCLDKAAKNAAEMTPPPHWVQEDRFLLAKESKIQSAIEKNIEFFRNLQIEHAALEETLKKAQKLKWLLFEKGKALEDAILIALKVLGYDAENLKEGDSEFDAVMLDPDGYRLIGEAEGKDDKAINVDKLDQLDRNLKEDFSKQNESSAKFATGVLFGNAYRLTAPDVRDAFFTAKCMLAAKRSHISLVRTTDLFKIAQYLEKFPSQEFAGKCRRAIREADGELVVFPTIPENK